MRLSRSAPALKTNLPRPENAHGRAIVVLRAAWHVGVNQDGLPKNSCKVAQLRARALPAQSRTGHDKVSIIASYNLPLNLLWPFARGSSSSSALAQLGLARVHMYSRTGSADLLDRRCTPVRCRLTEGTAIVLSSTGRLQTFADMYIL